MEIINCAKTTVYITASGYPIGDKQSQVLDHNQTLRLSFPGHDNIQLQIWAGRQPRLGSFLWDTVYGTVEVAVLTPKREPPAVPEDHSIIIIANKDPRLVDWTEVRKPYEARGKEVAGRDGENPEVDQALEVSKLLLSALTTATSALGPAGAVPAGFLTLFAGLIGGPTVAAPRPPNIQEISRVVEEVMKQLTDMNDAQAAGLCFAGDAEKFVNLLRRSRTNLLDPSANADDQTSKHLLEDVKDMIEYADRLGGPGTLKYSINHMAQYPEKAMYILPEFCEGIVVYLALYRLHLLELNQHGDTPDTIRVTKADVEEYRNKVALLGDALNAACQALENHGQAEARKHRVNDTLRENEFHFLVRRSMIGTTSTGKIVDIIWGLRRAVNLLDQDLATGNFEHFWSEKSLAQHQA